MSEAPCNLPLMTPFRLTAHVQAPRMPRHSPAPTQVAERGSPVRAEQPGAPLTTNAVAVPWRVARRANSGAIEVAHCGPTPLHSVRFALAGGGMLGLSLPSTVYPGERVRVPLRGAAVQGARGSPDAMLVLRWFEADGTELLWPIPLE